MDEEVLDNIKNLLLETEEKNYISKKIYQIAKPLDEVIYEVFNDCRIDLNQSNIDMYKLKTLREIILRDILIFIKLNVIKNKRNTSVNY